MKRIILLYFLTLVSCNNVDYKVLSSEKTNTQNLLKKINPNKNYDYWEINYCHLLEPKTILYKGDKKLKKKYNYNVFCNGFFQGCHPFSCSYTIVYLQNGKWNYIFDEKELAVFINKIDSPEEAFLIAETNGYAVDNNNKKGNGYIKTKNGYDLKVMKYNSCPESKEAFVVSIDSTGKIQSTTSQGFYLKTKNCIVY